MLAAISFKPQAFPARIQTAGKPHTVMRSSQRTTLRQTFAAYDNRFMNSRRDDSMLCIGSRMALVFSVFLNALILFNSITS